MLGLDEEPLEAVEVPPEASLGFLFWLNTKRDELINAHPGTNVGDLVELAQEIWNDMDDRDQKDWEARGANAGNVAQAELDSGSAPVPGSSTECKPDRRRVDPTTDPFIPPGRGGDFPRSLGGNKRPASRSPPVILEKRKKVKSPVADKKKKKAPLASKKKKKAPLATKKRKKAAPLTNKKRKKPAPAAEKKKKKAAPGASKKRKSKAPLASKKRKKPAPAASKKKKKAPLAEKKRKSKVPAASKKKKKTPIAKRR